jgi:hypothetical protein
MVLFHNQRSSLASVSIYGDVKQYVYAFHDRIAVMHVRIKKQALNSHPDKSKSLTILACLYVTRFTMTYALQC